MIQGVARILLVDDDQHTLDAFGRLLRARFEVTTAQRPRDALELLGKQPFDVVLTDMEMPEMNGLALLKLVKQKWPHVMRLVLSGQTNLEVMAKSLNEGGLFKYLIKPPSKEALYAAVDAAMEQKRLMNVERELLEKTVAGCVDALSETLALVNPEAFGRARRLKRIVSAVVKQLGHARGWQLEVAASLSQLGAVSLPPETAHRFFTGEALGEDDQAMLTRSALVPRQLLRHIPRLEPVIALLEAFASDAFMTASVDPLDLSTMRVASQVERRMAQGESVERIVESLAHTPQLDRKIVAAFRALLVIKPPTYRAVTLATMQPGMVLTEDVKTRAGALLIASGHEVSAGMLVRLQNFAATMGIKEPMQVAVPSDDSAELALAG